jgi:putative transposase
VARPPRIQIPDAIYHVTARGNERSAIYLQDGDRRNFLELLTKVVERYRWRILTYCLMTNHYHLLVQTPEANLCAGMRQLNGVYAQGFNRRHARVGHLFQGRYSARLVKADEHLWAAVGYVVRNPVRAGLCAAPEEWRWSSHRAMLGLEPVCFVDAPALLAYYGQTTSEARERYRVDCERNDRDEPPAHPLVYGDDVFIDVVLDQITPSPGVPRRYLQAPRPGLAELLREGDVDEIAGASERGYSQREIARHLGISASTVSRRLRRRRSHAGSATPET